MSGSSGESGEAGPSLKGTTSLACVSVNVGEGVGVVGLFVGVCVGECMLRLAAVVFVFVLEGLGVLPLAGVLGGLGLAALLP